MSDPAVFTVSKADPTGKEPTAGAVLHITADLSRVRETLPRAIWRAASINLHVEDAQQVAAALAHLPQGTIDQVLVLLLQQRASLLRVRVPESFPAAQASEELFKTPLLSLHRLAYPDFEEAREDLSAGQLVADLARAIGGGLPGKEGGGV